MVTIHTGPWQAAPIATGQTAPIFAIGDVHGHLDLLAALLDVVRVEAAEDPDSQLIYLGDLIDRGPNSARCLLMSGHRPARQGVGQVIRCLGNHEQMMRLAVAGDSGALRLWLRNGGLTTLHSMGLEPWDDLAERIPGPLADALEAMVPAHRIGNLLFVHAGIHPGKPLDAFLAMSPDLLPLDEAAHWAWIRSPFLEHEQPLPGGLLIIHGHTPEDSREARMHSLRPHRLGLDAGSYRTGRVAMAEFQPGRYRLIVAAQS